jgi:probable rRNA maturation factor
MADDPDAPRLRVVLTDRSGRPVHAGALGAWLREVAPPGARGTVTVALVGDATMRRLNRQFAGKDWATDVLSFPAFPPGRQEAGASAGKPARSTRERVAGTAAGGSAVDTMAGRLAADRCLGDIVIATGVARRQARDAGHSYERELRVLALHGLLHLLGYDHESDAGTMARVEARLRRKGGLSAGVIERGSRA